MKTRIFAFLLCLVLLLAGCDGGFLNENESNDTQGDRDTVADQESDHNHRKLLDGILKENAGSASNQRFEADPFLMVTIL